MPQPLDNALMVILIIAVFGLVAWMLWDTYSPAKAVKSWKRAAALLGLSHEPRVPASRTDPGTLRGTYEGRQVTVQGTKSMTLEADLRMEMVVHFTKPLGMGLYLARDARLTRWNDPPHPEEVSVASGADGFDERFQPKAIDRTRALAVLGDEGIRRAIEALDGRAWAFVITDAGILHLARRIEPDPTRLKQLLDSISSLAARIEKAAAR